MSTPESLFAALLGAPALPGAKCRGRSHLFDEAGADEDASTTEFRHQHAVTLCRSCAALASCQVWFDNLPRSKRPPGVVAGRVHGSSRAGRPRKAMP